MNKYVIITGGGSGSRMQQTLPKQFLEINGAPILFYTLTAFVAYQPHISIILTLPEEFMPYWNELVLQRHFTINHKVIAGGATRFQSVKNALALVPDGSLVAIHDAVRPFVSADVIAHSFCEAENQGSSIPIIPLVDSLRKITDTENHPINRAEIFAVQTPQTFKSSAIKQAYQVSENPQFTDDASVYEQSGTPIHIIAGNVENIKITNPFDLQLAEAFAKSLLHHPSFPQIGAFNRE